MPKKLSIRDIKGEKIHPYSRKASQMRRVLLRAAKLDDKKSKHKATMKDPLVDRFLWFKYAVDPELDQLTEEAEKELIELYLSRNIQELEELKKKNRKGQPPYKATRQDFLTMLIERETFEYEKSGFKLPDMTCKKNLEVLRNWEGDYGYLSLVKVKEIIREKKEKADVEMAEVKE